MQTHSGLTSISQLTLCICVHIQEAGPQKTNILCAILIGVPGSDSAYKRLLHHNNKTSPLSCFTEKTYLLGAGPCHSSDYLESGQSGKVALFHFVLSHPIKISSHLFELGPGFLPFKNLPHRHPFHFTLRMTLMAWILASFSCSTDALQGSLYITSLNFKFLFFSKSLLS